MNLNIKIKLHELLSRYPQFYVVCIFSYKLSVNFLILSCVKLFLKVKVFSKRDLLKDNSEVCFILGSGDSLNDVTLEQWSEIEASYSIGFNFSFLHHHQPNLQFIELAQDDRGMCNQLIERAINDFSSPIILKGLISFSKMRWAISKLRIYSRMKNVYMLRESTLPANIGSSLREALHRRYSSESINRFMKLGFAQSKGSITMMIDVAIQLGYKKIVMIGVDLQGPYFYEGLSKDFDTGQPEGTLLLQNRSRASSTIEEIILFWSKYLKNELDIDLYVSSSKSKLYPNLPLYWN